MILQIQIQPADDGHINIITLVIILTTSHNVQVQAKIKEEEMQVKPSLQDFNQKTGLHPEMAKIQTCKNCSKTQHEFNIQSCIEIDIENANTQVRVVERQQNIAIQEQETVRRERELDSKVRLFFYDKPAHSICQTQTK